MGLFNTTHFRVLEQGLQFTSANTRVIANNIANIDTPGFKSRYLTFSGVLRDRMDRNADHRFQRELHVRTNDVFVDEITSGQPDGNNVDFEFQASLLRQNALRQESLMVQLEAEFRMLRAAMRKQ
ncbi:MAG: flagellar basal body rod protein FlgB [Oscillospiraceae bacterium]|nr:flagellar basal body rod protein FlgB [Oscillospiraceae bacterium]